MTRRRILLAPIDLATRPKNAEQSLIAIHSMSSRRTEISGYLCILGRIFPEMSRLRPRRAALLLEQNDEWAVQRARYMTLVWGLNCQAVMSDRYRFPFVSAVSVFGVRGRSRIDRNESGGDRPRTERRHGMSDRKPKSHTMQKTPNAA
jgi:hypothetical protein